MAADGLTQPGRQVRLRLLGGFCLGTTIGTVVPQPVGQQILAILGLCDQPRPRMLIAARLWPDSEEDRAARSLRSAIWRLKSLRDDLISCQQSMIALGPHVEVDAREMVARSRQLLDSAPGDLPKGVDIDLFCQDLLPDWYDDWVCLERERLRHLRLASLERLAVRSLEAGDHFRAIHASTAVVQSEPMRESAHRILVEAYVELGDYCEAVRQYRIYCLVLERELGLSPSPLMQELVCPLLQR